MVRKPNRGPPRLLQAHFIAGWLDQGMSEEVERQDLRDYLSENPGVSQDAAVFNDAPPNNPDFVTDAHPEIIKDADPNHVKKPGTVKLIQSVLFDRQKLCVE